MISFDNKASHLVGCKTYEEVMHVVALNLYKILNNIMVLFFIQNFYYIFTGVDMCGPG